MRQRCALALLERAAKKRARGAGILPPFLPGVAPDGRGIANSAAVPLLTEWVVANAASVSPTLLSLARSLLPHLEMSNGSILAIESCPICRFPLKLDEYERRDYCSGTVRHKVERCMVSMQVVGGAWVWRCSSCRGKTVVATPRAVIDPCWRGADIDQWAEGGADVPCCPFCGILMHRVMPKSSLTPTLV